VIYTLAFLYKKAFFVLAEGHNILSGDAGELFILNNILLKFIK